MTTNENNTDANASEQPVRLSSRYIADRLEQEPPLEPSVAHYQPLSIKQLADVLEQMAGGDIDEVEERIGA